MSRELTTPPEPPNIDMQWMLNCAILPYHLCYISLSCMLHFLVVYATFPCHVCYMSLQCMLLCAILPCHLWYIKKALSCMQFCLLMHDVLHCGMMHSILHCHARDSLRIALSHDLLYIAFSGYIMQCGIVKNN